MLRIGVVQPFVQILFTVFVHQKTDAAAVHAVKRNAFADMFVQGFQHKPVAAQNDENVGFGARRAAVHPAQARQGLLCDFRRVRQKTDLPHIPYSLWTFHYDLSIIPEI